MWISVVETFVGVDRGVEQQVRVHPGLERQRDSFEFLDEWILLPPGVFDRFEAELGQEAQNPY